MKICTVQKTKFIFVPDFVFVIFIVFNKKFPKILQASGFTKPGSTTGNKQVITKPGSTTGNKQVLTKPDESIENYDFALFYVSVKVVSHINGRKRLRVFCNTVLRKMFGPKWEKVAREWRKVHNDELHGLY